MSECEICESLRCLEASQFEEIVDLSSQNETRERAGRVAKQVNSSLKFDLAVRNEESKDQRDRLARLEESVRGLTDSHREANQVFSLTFVVDKQQNVNRLLLGSHVVNVTAQVLLFLCNEQLKVLYKKGASRFESELFKKKLYGFDYIDIFHKNFTERAESLIAHRNSLVHYEDKEQLSINVNKTVEVVNESGFLRDDPSEDVAFAIEILDNYGSIYSIL